MIPGKQNMRPQTPCFSILFIWLVDGDQRAWLESVQERTICNRSQFLKISPLYPCWRVHNSSSTPACLRMSNARHCAVKVQIVHSSTRNLSTHVRLEPIMSIKQAEIRKMTRVYHLSLKKCSMCCALCITVLLLLDKLIQKMNTT